MSKHRRLLAAARGALALTLAVGLLQSTADAAGKRSLRGRTSQGRSVRLAIKGSTLKVLHFKAKLRCRDGSVLIDDESGFLPTRLRGGAFSDRQVGSTDTVWFKGKVGRRGVHGRLRVKDKYRRTRCDSHWVRFSAKR
jgi:hypothetical protein